MAWKQPRKSIKPSIASIDYIPERDKRVTFDQWAQSWWKTTAPRQPNTRRGYDAKLKKHVSPYFGDCPLAAISFSDVSDFIGDKVEEGLSNKTIQAMLTVNCGVMAYAINSGPRAPRRDNPARGHNVKVPRKRIREGDMLSMEQAIFFVSQVTEWFRLAVWVLLFTGIRPAEMCGLQVGDVKWTAAGSRSTARSPLSRLRGS